MGIAVGQIGLAVNDFLNLTPAEFDAIYQEWWKLSESKYKAGWEQTRVIAYGVVRQYDEKNKFPTPLHFLRFPWESETKAVEQKELSKAEQEKRFRLLAARWK